jgi:hypothetical protein
MGRTAWLGFTCDQHADEHNHRSRWHHRSLNIHNLACHKANALPHEFRPSAKYRGEVTVETANASGQLVLGNGFAWNYGNR